jgi:hypothetical protein
MFKGMVPILGHMLRMLVAQITMKDLNGHPAMVCADQDIPKTTLRKIVCFYLNYSPTLFIADPEML